MPIIEMKKVFLLGHEQEKNTIVSALHKMGAVELVDVKEGGSWEDFSRLLEPDRPAEEISELESTLGEIRYCLDFLQRYFPVRKSFVEQFTGSKLSLEREQFEQLIKNRDQLKDVARACREADEKMARLRNEETQARNLIGELEPWASLDVPFAEVKTGARAVRELITVPTDRFELLKQELDSRFPAHYLEPVSADNEYTYCLAIYLVTHSDGIRELFKDAAASTVNFADLDKKAAEEIEETNRRLEALEDNRAAVVEDIEKLLEHRTLLMSCYDHLQAEVEKMAVSDNLARTRSSFLLEGWAPALAIPDLEKKLEQAASTAVVVSRDPEPGEDVPVLLHNKGPVDAYEVVTKLYSTPKKNELDPTPYLAPFFFIFFGICLSDVGYGIVLSLMALFITRKLKLGGMGEQLVKLLFLGGIASIGFGILLGSYFGDLLGLTPLWFNPLDDPMRMLLYCLIIGLVHIYFGMGLQAYRNIKAGRPVDALFDQGSWFIFLNGLVLMAIPETAAIASWLAIGGAAALVLTQGRTQDGVVKKLMSGVLSLYNVTGYLSDVLSYSRLLALGLATGVIASAINAMGGMVAGGIFGTIVMVIVLMGGHLFNIIISTLSSYVHTSRLQYIEFFGKFFEGGGKAFQPFRTSGSYVEINEPEKVEAG